MRKQSWGERKKNQLDVLIEKYRFFQIIKSIPANSIVLDLGCGYHAGLLNFISSKINHGVGIDISVAKGQKEKNIALLKSRVDDKINLKNNGFDIITALAVIEHTVNPGKMLKEAYRLLKQDGTLLLTTPDKKAKPLLEFLAFRLGVINKDEIKDHKKYYSKKSLVKILINSGFEKKKIKVKTFEMGLNLFVKATK